MGSRAFGLCTWRKQVLTYGRTGVAVPAPRVRRVERGVAVLLGRLVPGVIPTGAVPRSVPPASAGVVPGA